MTFEDFNLCGAFINALEEKGYTYPPPIEKETIPFILSGKDIAATVKTDTAKAFCISGFGNTVTNRSQIRTAWSNRICVIISHSRKKRPATNVNRLTNELSSNTSFN